MTTTEKRLSDSDLTVLVERAAQGSWDSQLGPASGAMWDEVPHGTKNSYREQVLSIIFHGTKALNELGYRKPHIITTVEELDALPEGSIILTPSTNPNYPSAFRKVWRGEWLELDPGDKSDGECGVMAAGLLRWDSIDNTATVVFEPDAEVGA